MLYWKSFIFQGWLIYIWEIYHFKVKLATQVLSRYVAITLQESEDEEVLGTAMFCPMLNDYFDCTNVRSTTEHTRKRKEFIKLYLSCDDQRLVWTKQVFLKYLDDWKKNTLAHPGIFSPDERAKMFLSAQAYQGLQISVYAHIEAIQFLLKEGFPICVDRTLHARHTEGLFWAPESQGR